VAFLPMLAGTREGIAHGLRVEAHSSDHIEFWMLQAVGGILGGLGGYQASGALISRLVSDGRAGAAYMRIPAAGAASVAFFVLGKELAGPATTLGLKIGKARPIPHTLERASPPRTRHPARRTGSAGGDACRK